ncbi:3-coathanger stack domain-containing protein [Arcticibacterium luteifluviistationis]|uniref:Secretion system C-terminal sorting domain-containing protein n=1 Tax=Arcticibacterium luteifluviistationis TaxID=1784714 RepID=A0A2Z4GDZ9_9BACT|nr:3-coathanger stack domain-containing protein [Arcticibacterium luteifluviistationis]AWV99371.1 hypothetical protein DJ013_14855 [Arcticibacterium luteifluviistationis]
MELRIKTIFGALILCLFASSSIFAQFPINIGTLEEGDTLVIIYDAKVKEFGSSVTEISNQLKLTGSGIATVLSNDPDITGAANPTLTGALSPVADLAILGNGQEIVDGSVSTSVLDSTSFGVIGLTETQSVDFYLKNVGFNGLQLDSVKVFGLNGSTGFKLNTPVLDFGTAPYDSLKSGDSLLLSIVFEPLAICPDSAEVIVYTSDVDEGVYSFYITGEATDGIVSNTSDNGCGSLRDVLAKASAGDTIRFSEIIAGDTIKLTSGEILLDKDVTIVGNSTYRTIIDGQANGRVLQVSSGVNAFLDSLIIQNGNATIQGAGIMNSGNVVMKASIIRNNTTTADGGGVATQGDFKIYNSYLQGNTGNGGGGIRVMNNNLDVYNSQISGNKASIGGGVNNSGGTIRLYNTTVAGNMATNRGGGISMYGNSAFANTIIAGNTSPSNTDIYYDDCGSSLTDLGNNLIGDATDVSGLFLNSTLKGTSAVLLDPLFIENVPTAPSIGGNLRLSFCSPAINAGKDTLGYGIPSFDLVNLPRIFAGGMADIGAFEFQGNPELATIIYVDSAATSGGNSGTDWANAFLDLQMALDAASCSEIDTVFVAKGSYKPSKYNNAIPSDPRLATFSLQDSLIILGGFSPANNIDSLHERNWETYETILSGNIQLDGSYSDNAYHVITAKDIKGGMIDGLVISEGFADGIDPINTEGGGMFLHAMNVDSVSLIISNCLFENNYAEDKGGAIHILAENGKTMMPSLLNNFFLYNYSDLYGGAIYIAAFGGKNISLIDSNVFGFNAAVYGGAISLNSIGMGINEPQINRSVFGYNYADDLGGAINVSIDEGNMKPLIDSCHFVTNSAYFGGGAINTDVYGLGASNDTQISNSIFEDNIADDEDGVGGAISIYTDNVGVINNTNIFNARFAGNIAGFGGAVSVSSYDGTVNSKIAQSLFLDNLALESGAIDVYVEGDGIVNSDIINSTIVKNYSDTLSAITSTNFDNGISNTRLINSIVSSNINGIGYGGVNYASSTDSVKNSIISNVDCASLGAGKCGDNVFFNTYPDFLDSAANDFQLQPYSIGVNTGIVDTTGFSLGLLDQNSNPRVFGGRIDLGVFEAQVNISILAGVKTNPTECLGADGSIAFSSTNLPDGTYSLSYDGFGSPQMVTVSSGQFLLSGLKAGVYKDFTLSYYVDGSSITLSDPAIPTITASSKTNPTTCLGTEGTIVFSSTNLSAGSHTVSFKKGTTSTSQSVTVASGGGFTLAGLGAGSYSAFSVTEHACEGTFATAQVLADPATPTIAVTSKTSPTTCLGTDGTIVFSSTNLSVGTHTVSFKKGTTSTSQSVTVASGGGFTLSGLGAGSYADFSVTEHACEGTFATSQVLVDPATPSITATSKTSPTTCLGTEGTIVFSSTNLSVGIHTVSFKKGTTSTSQSVTVASGGGFTLSGLGAGSYADFSVTEHACEGTFATAQVLADPTTPSITATSKTSPTTCLGTDGTIVFSSTNLSVGIHTVSFKKGTTSTSQSVTVASGGDFTLSGLGAGSYSDFSVTEHACEGTFATAQVLSGPVTPTITAISNTSPTTCLGTEGTIVFSSTNLSSGSHTVSFKKGTTSTSQSVTVASGGGFTLAGLGAGSYADFSVTEHACEGTFATAQVLADPATPTITATSNTSPTTCLGTEGTIVFSSSNLSAGSHTVSFKKGTTSTSQSITVASGGGFTLSGLGAGSYADFSVIEHACEGTFATAQVLADPATPTITATSKTSPTTCLGTDGSVVFSSTNLSVGSHAVSFKKGTTSTSQSITVASGGGFTLSGLGAGSYSDFSVPSHACEGTFATAQVLTDPVTPTITATSNTNPTTCLGTDGSIVFSSSNLSAGSHAVSFKKGTTSTSQSITVASGGGFTLSGLGAGSYSDFSVIEHACEGTFATAQVLADPATPTITATSKTSPTTCLGTDGSIVFSSSNLSVGSHTISFKKGATSTSQAVTVAGDGSFTLSSLGSGSYSDFSVTEHACEGTFATAQVLADPATPTITATSKTSPTTCLGTDGSIEFSSTDVPLGSQTVYFNKGSADASQVVTVGGDGSFTLSNLTAAQYSNFSVTVNGCQALFSETQILVDPLGSISASNTGPYNEGDMINLNVTGGSVYSWTGPSGYFSSLQNPSIVNATSSKAGLYMVTVSDVNNCSYTATTEVLVSCSSQKLNYYLVFSDDNPQIISPLVEDLQVQATSRPMSVVAISSCSQPTIESVKFQLSGTSNLQYYVDNNMPFNLHENMNVNIGDVLAPNHYTFISRGYSQDNAQGSVIVGPDVIPFDVLWYGRTISEPTSSVTEVCAGSSLVVSANSENQALHPYGVGNLYQVYLSEPSGSFSTRTFIGSGSDANAINCQIPLSIAGGDNYKIMVVSTSPVVASEPSVQSVKVIGSDLVLTSPQNDLTGELFSKNAINVIKAENNITSTSKGTYKAGRFIELNEGFEIEGGSVFEAKIGTVCP